MSVNSFKIKKGVIYLAPQAALPDDGTAGEICQLDTDGFWYIYQTTGGWTPLLTTDVQQTIENKYLVSSVVPFVNGADNSVKLYFSLTGDAGTQTTIKSDVTDSRTITLPDATTTLVGDDSTQTLTNKTIDGDDNTITDISLTSLKTVLSEANKLLQRDASGDIVATLTAPTGDVVGTSDTQTLTNKTIDGDDNTISDLALSALKTVLGDANKFLRRDDSGIVVSDKTAPTGDVVGTSDSQTLTNKTLAASNNTISGLTNANIDATAVIDRSKIAAGTANSVVINGGDGSFSDVQLTADYVVITDADGIPTTEEYLAKSRGGTAQDNSSITFPSSGVLVTEAGSEILTNKTIVVSDNTITTAASGNLTSTELNAALAELQNDIDLDVPRTKVEAGTGNYVVINDADGNLSEEATLAKSRGGAGADMSSVTFPTTGTIATQAGEESFSNKSFSDAVTIAEQTSTPTTPSSGFGAVYFKDDGKLYQLNDSGSETEVGAGGSGGGINYIDNPDFETNVIGWILYADGAATPTDGTGGTATATFERTTTTPLRGVGSGLFTPGTLGDGVAYDFTIDAADKATLQSIQFDYILGDTISEGDYTLWIYDVTNDVLIQPSGYSLPSGVADTPYKAQALFQTASDSTSYRLLVHQAVTTSTTLKIDNVSVGPQVKTYGVPVTDWEDFTPTGSWSTNCTYTGKKKRSGDSLEMIINIAIGGSVGSPGALTIDVPDGLSIDSANKLPAVTAGVTSLPGNGSLYDSSAAAASNVWPTLPVYSSDTAFYVQALNSGDVQTITQSSPITPASGDKISVYVKIPIQGWSSNTLMSSSADTRVVAFRAHSSGGTALPTSDGTVYVYGTVDHDTHGAYSATSGTYTVKVPGKYRVSASIATATGTYAVGNLVKVAIYKNGSSQKEQWWRITSTQSDTYSVEVIDEFDCAAGDTIDIRPAKTGTAVNALSTSVANVFSVSRISGPSQIAATETISERYSRSTTLSIPNTGETRFQPDTKTHSTHGAVTTGSSWVFTAPAAGLYSIKFAVAFDNSTYAAGNRVYVSIYKNSVAYSQPAYWWSQAAVSTRVELGNSDDVELNAGDTIYLAIANNRTAGATDISASDGNSFVSITRIGL